MREIIKNLWVGDSDDVAEAKRRQYSRLACCKDGTDSHRSMLGYTTMGAPHDQFYYAARQGNVVALNIIDSEDPDMVPDVVIDVGLRFIKQELDAGRKILVHCNAGMSRSPSIVLMFLRAIAELPQGFNRAEHVFKTLYPKYSPAKGIRTHARTRWKSLPTFFTK